MWPWRGQSPKLVWGGTDDKSRRALTNYGEPRPFSCSATLARQRPEIATLRRVNNPIEPARFTSLSKTAWPPQFEAPFEGLAPSFYSDVNAAALPDPYWVAWSEECATSIGWPKALVGENNRQALDLLSGHTPWAGIHQRAGVYSGHQFGVWAGQLGDGRALSLGTIQTPTGRQELQLKGAGRTPYSRMGDGRAVLRSSIREFLCSEAMHALGVPTTRALCVTGSALPVMRETLETAAVLTRVAPSFLRFGHFEHFGHSGRLHELGQLLNLAIDQFEPQCRESPNPALAWLEAVARKTASLIAHWQSLGFCHGVLNTDNLSILGLTLDYGPFGFMDAFDPGHVCNHSDDYGRYAYDNQPDIGYWNLHALAHALTPLLPDAQAGLAAIAVYVPTFTQQWHQRFADKLGLAQREADDEKLISDWLALMAASATDFTLCFRELAEVTCADAAREGNARSALRDLFHDQDALTAWLRRYGQRLERETSIDEERSARMRQVNPRFVLRNHLCEQAIERARMGDFSVTSRLHKVLQTPFEDQPDNADLAALPPPWAKDICVSCSS